MRKLFSIVAMVAGFSYGTALAEPADSALPSDNRIKLLMYDEADVYTITTRYGYQTNIVFSPKEEVETISVGDRSVWQIIPAGNRLFIRPMDEDVTTNMTVLTNKHSYQFDLKSIASDKSEGNIYVARFVYPDDKKKTPELAPKTASAALESVVPPPATAPIEDVASKSANVVVPSPCGFSPSVPAPASDAPASPAVAAADAAASPSKAPALPGASAAGESNYNYTYAGADELAPLQVYDDGKTTFIKYNTETPPTAEVFTIDNIGHESPVNVVVKDSFLQVDAVAGEMVLKSKGTAIHIFNENMNTKVN